MVKRLVQTENDAGVLYLGSTGCQTVLPRSSLAHSREFAYFLLMSDKPSKLKIADREFTSRLLVGTGKFASNELMRDALVASGTELVTVALRRADISGKRDRKSVV